MLKIFQIFFISKVLFFSCNIFSMTSLKDEKPEVSSRSLEISSKEQNDNEIHEYHPMEDEKKLPLKLDSNCIILDLSDYSISDIPNCIFHFVNLKELHLANNEIVTLSKKLATLDLNILNLENNCLSFEALAPLLDIWQKFSNPPRHFLLGKQKKKLKKRSLQRSDQDKNKKYADLWNLTDIRIKKEDLNGQPRNHYIKSISISGLNFSMFPKLPQFCGLEYLDISNNPNILSSRFSYKYDKDKQCFYKTTKKKRYTLKKLLRDASCLKFLNISSCNIDTFPCELFKLRGVNISDNPGHFPSTKIKSQKINWIIAKNVEPKVIDFLTETNIPNLLRLDCSPQEGIEDNQEEWLLNNEVNETETNLIIYLDFESIPLSSLKITENTLNQAQDTVNGYLINTMETP